MVGKGGVAWVMMSFLDRAAPTYLKERRRH